MINLQYWLTIWIYDPNASDKTRQLKIPLNTTTQKESMAEGQNITTFQGSRKFIIEGSYRDDKGDSQKILVGGL